MSSFLSKNAIKRSLLKGGVIRLIDTQTSPPVAVVDLKIYQGQLITRIMGEKIYSDKLSSINRAVSHIKQIEFNEPERYTIRGFKSSASARVLDVKGAD